MPFPEDNILPGGNPYRIYDIFRDFLAKDFIKDGFNEETLATEIERCYDTRRGLDEVYKRRKAIAPDWRFALDLWVKQIENSLDNASYYSDVAENIHLISKIAYNAILRGFDTPLIGFVDEIFKDYFESLRRYELPLPGLDEIATNKNFIHCVKKALFNIAKGTALAYKVSQWKKELQLKNELVNNKVPLKYSLKQIAIAYFVMNIPLDEESGKKALDEHSDFKSVEKLLQKRFTNSIELTRPTGNGSSNTKHLKDLEAAERLVSGKKNKSAVNSMHTIIATFKANLEKRNY
jgi:hypothetical protein